MLPNANINSKRIILLVVCRIIILDSIRASLAGLLRMDIWFIAAG